MYPFQKVFKNFSEIELRKGLTGGDYCSVKIKLGTLRKKELHGVLAIMHEITERTPQISARAQQSIPVGGYRK